MLPGFQQYLVDKGFKRTCCGVGSKERVENYTSIFLSTYNPLDYEFRKDDKYCYWGLCEYQKPPVMFLGNEHMLIISNNRKTNEDGYRILFSKWKEDKFDEIYDVFMSEDKYFRIDCEDEKYTKITIEQYKALL